MKINNYTPDMGIFLVAESKWHGRTFKSFQELDKLYNKAIIAGKRRYEIPPAPNGQIRKIYTGYMNLGAPILFEDAFSEWFYRGGILQYLQSFGTGTNYQEAWDNCFCEEMFVPVVAGSPTKVNTWYAFPQYIPPKNDMYCIRVKNNQVGLYAWYSKQMRGFVDIDKNPIQGVTTWKFRDTHEWNHFLSHKPTIEGTYEVSKNGVLNEFVYRDVAFEYKGEIHPPGFVDIGRPYTVDWWREIKSSNQKVHDDEDYLRESVPEGITVPDGDIFGIPISHNRAALLLGGSDWLDRVFVKNDSLHDLPNNLFEELNDCDEHRMPTLRQIMNETAGHCPETWNGIICDLAYNPRTQRYDTFAFDEEFCEEMFEPLQANDVQEFPQSKDPDQDLLKHTLKIDLPKYPKIVRKQFHTPSDEDYYSTL